MVIVFTIYYEKTGTDSIQITQSEVEDNTYVAKPDIITDYAMVGTTGVLNARRVCPSYNLATR